MHSELLRHRCVVASYLALMFFLLVLPIGCQRNTGEATRSTTPKNNETAEDSFRLLSYNIHMWQIDVESLAAIIHEADVDIVGLNEAWDGSRNDELAEKLGYQIIYGGMDSAGETEEKPHSINGFYMPQVLLTKHRIVESQVFNAMAEKNHERFDPEVPIYRGGTLAVLETEAGNRVVVFVLHLHPWGDGNNEEMTTMRLEEMNGILKKLEAYQDLPKIIIGDFNTRSHFEEEAGWKVTKRLADAGYSDLFRSLNPDHSAKPGLTCGDGRIDYIFHDEHFAPIECKVVEDGVFGSRGYEQSDHLAVFGEIKLVKQK